jgi:predicted lactoylglutathione lyase
MQLGAVLPSLAVQEIQASQTFYGAFGFLLVAGWRQP